jgi:tellurite resistance protein TerC
MHHHGVAWAPEIPILVSLAVIVGTLAVTTVLSLMKSRRDAAAATTPGDELSEPGSRSSSKN